MARQPEAPVDGSAQIEIEVLTGLDQIAPEDWDACACPEAADGGRPNDPFTTHRFLSALERSRSVGTGPVGRCVTWWRAATGR
jgi:predicted N-acyltransferase